MQNKHQEKYTPNKTRQRSNKPGVSVSSTLGGNIVFVLKGREYQQNEFMDVWINGKDL